MARRIAILDTTLRDGGRAPGFSMCLDEKLEVARHLARLGVDVVEAGRPALGRDEHEAVSEIARVVREPVIAAAARASASEIDAAWNALRGAERPRLHVMLGSSTERLAREFGAECDRALELAAEAVGRAKRYCSDVEFSAADATRADPAFLRALLAIAVKTGATVVNVADTVGRVLPDEFAALIRLLLRDVPGLDKIVLSVHCHDDLGLATANSLAAVLAGASQIECAVNGLGDKAGNAALEEVVMALATRSDYLDAYTSVDTTRLYGSSRLVQAVTGLRTQPNKAVVGDYALPRDSSLESARSALAAASGLSRSTTVGGAGGPRSPVRTALGRRTGRRVFEERLALLGYELRPESVSRLYAEFRTLAQRKGSVSDRDLEALVLGETARAPESFRLERFVVNSGTGIASMCAVKLSLPEGGSAERVAVGDGPIDAAFKAVDRIIGVKPMLEHFAVDAVTEGRDAQGEARVRIRFKDRRFNGRGLSTDIIEAAVLAYLAAMNAMTGEMEAEYGTNSVS